MPDTDLDHAPMIVELMGHRRLAGYVSDATIAGAGFLRVDVPTPAGEVIQFYAPSAVYCLTPTTPEIVEAMAERNAPAPIQPWELPSGIERRVEPHEEWEDDDDA